MDVRGNEISKAEKKLNRIDNSDTAATISAVRMILTTKSILSPC
jgi:hypothetical protein